MPRTRTPDSRKGFGWFLTSVYNTAFFAFALLYSPFFLKKLRQADDTGRLLNERLGRFPRAWKENFRNKKLFWIHAVSVGEVMAVQPLVRNWTKRIPSVHLLLTTVTPTGQKIAKELEGSGVTVCYFPFDLSFVVKRFFRFFRPAGLILAETEIWPNLIGEAERLGVPVGLINARLSERSQKRYAAFPSLFRPLFKALSFVLAQAEPDGRRFEKLGVPAQRVRVLGNLKFDGISFDRIDDAGRAEARKISGFAAEDLILIAGSTHPGEEEMAVRVFRELRADFPRLKLVLAPRHVERAKDIACDVQEAGLSYRLAASADRAAGQDVLILDRLGVLKHLYAIADVVLMGGSWVRRGGQNPIEPAGAERAILHGPHIFNFSGIYEILDREEGSLCVQNEPELKKQLQDLLKKVEVRTAMGEKAFSIVRGLRGATERHLDWLLNYFGLECQEGKLDEEEPEKLLSPSRGGP